MPRSVIAYIGAVLTFLVLDGIWLGFVALSLYRSRLGTLLLEKPNMAVAGVFYVAYVAGVVYLAVLPALRGGDWTVALMHGAVLGFVAYGTYDLTNLATLRGWPVDLALIDLAWGTVVSAVAAVAGYFAAAAFAPVPG